MKICTMLFVGLLLEASLFASESESDKKCIEDKGLEDKKPGITTMLYSSNDLLQSRRVQHLTVEKQRREALLILMCLRHFEDYKNNLSISPESKKKQDEYEKFNEQNKKLMNAAKLEQQLVLQEKKEAIKAECQRLKDLKTERLLEKKEGYKNFAVSRTRYSNLVKSSKPIKK
ncbi:MAG: hypothetical protein Q8Q60_04480 [Candidatus Chromulinivorax sp.]|nr:hypothetical protein [Candidatus Chromulinivorax sp.]